MIEHAVNKMTTPPVVHDSTWVDAGADGEGVLVALKGTPNVGDSPVFDGTDFVPEPAGSASGFVPTYIGPAETFTVPANRQAPYAILIENDGMIALGANAYLVFVD